MLDLTDWPELRCPENVVAAPVKPGHATGVVTVPPQGSVTGVGIAEKSPARSAGVGTVVVNGVPMRRRKPSQLTNQKVLSRPS